MTTVYILGAGASAGFDRSATGMQCPAAGNFFTVACRLLDSDPALGMTDISSFIFFLDKYFNLSPAGVEEAGLDMQDVLTFLDLELEYCDSAGEAELLKKAREEFMDLLTITYNKVISGPPCPYHAKLASSLEKGDTVISFNYDLLMDTAMLQNCRDWRPESGYGLQAEVPVSIKTGHIPHRSENLLLKPHGSFNWVVCRNCGSFFALPPGSAAFPTWKAIQEYMPRFSRHRPERLIIPPSLKKDMHGSAMRVIWGKAYDALKNAGRLVVIGYSLPATDYMVKRLLYRSLSGNRNINEFELVDRNNSRPGSELSAKYRSILKCTGKQVKAIADRLSIREYASFLSAENSCEIPVKDDKIT